MKQQKTRLEKDSFGSVKVPANKHWGAQTQRALKHFMVGEEKMPGEVITAYAMIKKAAALTNAELNLLPKNKAQAIVKVANEIIKGNLSDHFTLHVWQTGSGTQTNMNVNEVIANRAKIKLHPNDDVNKGQSSNDTFPTAMHMATIQTLTCSLLPSIKLMRDALAKKQQEFKNIKKIGRTHLQDAVPMTLGEEFSAFVAQLDADIKRIKSAMTDLYFLPIGGTAIGTGLNAHPEFAKRVCKKITEFTKLPFKPAKNKFALIAAHDDFVFLSGALKTLAATLMKIANDIRWLASGPRCGLGELILPANEPGSSIMPGKVNPTQCEAMTMVCAQVMGNDATISFACSQGNFQLNTFKPVIIYNLLQSVRLLSGANENFTKFLVKGLRANKKKIAEHLDNSLMLITELVPQIGYDEAAKIVASAQKNNTSQTAK